MKLVIRKFNDTLVKYYSIVELSCVAINGSLVKYYSKLV